MAYSPVGHGSGLLENAMLKKIARRHNATTSKIALAWVLGQAGVIAIPKASSKAHVRDNARSTEIKLTNVARASLEELLEDYRDFLRVRGLKLWEKNSREAMFVRKLGSDKNASYETYRTYIETRPPEVAANILICLIHQTNYLLDQQIRQLEKAFLEEGGLRERMTHARLTRRAQQNRK